MKKIVFAVTALIFISAFAVGTSADALSEDYGNFFGNLPDVISRELPDGIGTDPSYDADKLTSWDYLLYAVGGSVADELKKVMPTFCILTGLVVLSAICDAFSSSLGSSAITGLALPLAVTVAAAGHQAAVLSSVASYFHDLSVLVDTVSPVALTLYAAGGNVEAGTVGATAFTVFLSFTENVIAGTVMGFSGCVTGLYSAAYALPGASGLESVAAFLRKTYVTVLTFLSSLFCAVLAAQSAVASAKDSVSLRAAKFVAGSAIPLVGGAVGESLKTLSSGVSLMRKCFGVTGIAVVAILTLPVLILLLASRLAMSAAGTAAGLFGQDKLKKLLDGIASVYGCLIAASAVCSLTFVFLLILLAAGMPAF